MYASGHAREGSGFRTVWLPTVSDLIGGGASCRDRLARLVVAGGADESSSAAFRRLEYNRAGEGRRWVLSCGIRVMPGWASAPDILLDMQIATVACPD